MRSSSEWNVTTASRPPGCSTRSAACERAHELAELVVDGDAQRLEGAGRRMDAAGLGPDEAGDELGELAASSRCGALRAALDDGARDGARAALLAVMEEDVGELGLGGAR